MTNQTIQRYKNTYVVRRRDGGSLRDAKSLLEKLAKLRDATSRKWRGSPDAVAEIRDQRGGAL